MKSLNDLYALSGNMTFCQMFKYNLEGASKKRNPVKTANFVVKYLDISENYQFCHGTFFAAPINDTDNGNIHEQSFQWHFPGQRSPKTSNLLEIAIVVFLQIVMSFLPPNLPVSKMCVKNLSRLMI